METLTFEQLPKAFTQLFIKVENIEKLLQSKQESKNEEDKPLTIQQAADFISLSVPTIYGLVHDLKIPFSKKGKRLYFSKVSLIEWVNTGRRKTIAEIQNKVVKHTKESKN